MKGPGPVWNHHHQLAHHHVARTCKSFWQPIHRSIEATPEPHGEGSFQIRHLWDDLSAYCVWGLCVGLLVRWGNDVSFNTNQTCFISNGVFFKSLNKFQDTNRIPFKHISPFFSFLFFSFFFSFPFFSFLVHTSTYVLHQLRATHIHTFRCLLIVHAIF